MLIPLCLSAACATTSAVSRSTERQPLEVDAALALVMALEQPAPQVEKPQSLDEAMALIRRDELSAYATARAFAERDPSPRGRTLKAQVDLAWGEAELLTAELLVTATRHLTEEQQRLQSRASSGLTPTQAQRLELLDATLTRARVSAESLTRLGNGRLSTAIAEAEAVTAEHPTDQVGWGVAADFYRLTGDWAGFDRAMAQLEVLAPDSIALKYARAMGALDRLGDRSAAVKLLQQVTAQAPDFTRARARLLLMHVGFDDAWKHFELLRQAQPRHQVVLLVGPALSAEHDEMVAAADRAAMNDMGAGQNYRAR